MVGGWSGRSPELFNEAATVEMPPGTRSWNRPLEAAAAFRRGDRQRAYEILLTHIDEILAVDDMANAQLTALDFVDLMGRLDRLTDAARLLAT